MLMVGGSQPSSTTSTNPRPALGGMGANGRSHEVGTGVESMSVIVTIAKRADFAGRFRRVEPQDSLDTPRSAWRSKSELLQVSSRVTL